MNKKEYVRKIDSINKRIKKLENELGKNNIYVENYRAKAHAIGIEVTKSGRISKSYKSDIEKTDIEKLLKLPTYMSLSKKMKKEYGKINKKEVNQQLIARSELNTEIEKMLDFMYNKNNNALLDFRENFVKNENGEKKSMNLEDWLNAFDYINNEYDSDFNISEYKEFFK